MSSTTEHISLVGFMASGKTTVGKALAERIGLPFIDVDEQIAVSAGKSIPSIFKDEGEIGFRARERRAVRDLVEGPAAVIATGGGTYADPTLRQLLRGAGKTVYLEASFELIQERMSESKERGKRPMLKGPDPDLTIKRLLRDRSAAYRESDATIPVDGQSPEALVERILTALALDAPRRRGGGARAAAKTEAREELRVPSSEVPGAPLTAELKGPAIQEPETTDGSLRVSTGDGAYSIHFRARAGGWIADSILEVCRGRRIAIITDDNVARRHAEALRIELDARGKSSKIHQIPAGEQSKSLGQASRLYDALLVQELDRKDCVVALGGGVVGDLAGFVASTFLRGIDFIQVPTTTLACVDSSVGGKTGINTPRGKNLVGTFHAPRAVCIAGSHLETLDRQEHVAGLAEVVKKAVCLDAELLRDVGQRAERLANFDMDVLLPVLRRAVALKATVVSQDEREQGLRAVLNYGHTLGHAIERGENFTIRHGEAVGLGMIAEAEWAEAEGIASDVAPALRAILQSLGLPTHWRNARFDAAALRLDKKRSGTTVTMPVVTALGVFEFRSVPVSALAEFVTQRSAG